MSAMLDLASSTVQAISSGVLKAFGSGLPEVIDGVPWYQKEPHGRYKFLHQLGKGATATTYLVEDRKTKTQYACKVLSKKQPTFQRKYIEQEVCVMARVCQHPNIVTLYEVWEDRRCVYLIMETCLGGELFDLIIKRGHVSEREAATVTRCILDVLRHMHAHGVVHRDLKPENFLLLTACTQLDAANLRVVDFGLSSFWSEHDPPMTELVGSAFYVAPEVLRGCYACAADLWSTGVILYILLSGMPPFAGNTEKEIFTQILEADVAFRMVPWPEVSASAKDLVKRMLVRDASKRITTQAALQHPWLREQAAPDCPLSSVVIERLREFTQFTRLKTLLLNIVARNLSRGEIEHLKVTFRALDTDDDGMITLEELREGLMKLQGWERRDDPEAIMAAMDVSRDGVVQYEEFIAAAVDRNKALTQQTLASIFELVDRDHDGFITAEELRLALQECNIAVSEADMAALLSLEGLPDSDQHGHAVISQGAFENLMADNSTSSRVSAQRLEHILGSMHESFHRRNQFKQLGLLVIVKRCMRSGELQGMPELFKKLDVDANGWVDAQEFQQGLKRVDSKLSEGEIMELMHTMDMQHTGRIGLDDFVTGALDEDAMLTEAKMRAAFNFIDKDGSGYIDLDELKTMLSELGIDTVQVQSLMEMADTNHDNLVDFDEFREIMSHNAMADSIISRSMPRDAVQPAQRRGLPAPAAAQPSAPAAFSQQADAHPHAYESAAIDGSISRPAEAWAEGECPLPAARSGVGASMSESSEQPSVEEGHPLAKVMLAMEQYWHKGFMFTRDVLSFGQLSPTYRRR